MFSSCLHLLWVLQVSPTSQNHSIRWTCYTKLLLAVNECVHGPLERISILYIVCLCLPPSVGTASTPTLTKNKMVNEDY